MELLIIIVIIISAAFPDPRDIKMGHSILRTFSKKKKRIYTFLAFLMSNIVGNIF